MSHPQTIARRGTLVALALLSGLLLAAALAYAAAAQRVAARPHTGSALRRLTTDGSTSPLAWAADGQTLLVGRPGRALPEQGLAELWSVSLAGAQAGSARLLSENAFCPAVHGNHVAFLRYRGAGNWEVALLSLDERTDSQVLTRAPASWRLPPRWIDGAAWYADPLGRVRSTDSAASSLGVDGAVDETALASLSPDGALLARVDASGLRVVPAHAAGAEASTATAHLLHEGDLVGHMAWSPAAQQLAYVRLDQGPSAHLWVWDAVASRQWLVHSVAHGTLSDPAWSPDGRSLAFAVHAAGSGPAAGGDLWLVRADGTAARALAATRADESHPLWSPDGRSLAFSLEGDVWIADLSAPDLRAALSAAAGAAWSPPVIGVGAPQASAAGVALSASAPVTIRVKHDADRNTCRDRPPGAVDVYGFEDYVKRVVPYEVYTSWPGETLRAQAVAARTYAWKKLLQQRNTVPDPGYDVWDSTRDQYMCDRTYASTDQAVDATTGQYISYAGSVIYAFFSAEAGSPTNYREELNLQAAPYLRPVDDPVGFGQTRRGHSWGMSQWGAYRWAAWHGWDYIQILTHYYSFATVSPSSPAPNPLAAISRPWPGAYVTADQVYAAVNAGGAVEAITVRAQVTDTWTVACTDTEGADGWGCVWPLAHLADTDRPLLAMRATVHGAGDADAESAVSWIGLHRTPPTGKLGIEHTPVHTVNVVLDLYAHDPAPVDGPLYVGLGNDDWVWEAHALSHIGGQIISDPGAEDGTAWYVDAGGDGGRLYGPYTTRLPGSAPYRALFRIRAPEAALTNPQQIARLDVAADAGETLLGIHYLHGTDLHAGDAYADYAVDFWRSEPGPIEFRVDASGASALCVDRVRVIAYPSTVPQTMTWTLPVREGTSTVTAKFVDAAGNHSADVTLPVDLVDNTAPGPWRRLACGLSSCTVEVRDAIAGLDVSSAAYRLSYDGGSSWPTGWLPANCTGTSGSQGWEIVSAPPLPDGATPPHTRIQFRVADAAAAPNTAHSPAYAIWRAYMPLILK